MKHFLLAVTLCLAFSFSALARQTDDTPASKEDVQRYLEVVHSHEMIDKMMNAMMVPIHQMMHEEFLKNKDKLPADFEQRANKLTDDMFKKNRATWDEMMQAMIPAYQKHFTKGDMKSLTAFYSSATGQKMLREMPAIMAETMQSVMPIMHKQIEEMHDQIRQQMAEMMKQSEKKAGQATKN